MWTNDQVEIVVRRVAQVAAQRTRDSEGHAEHQQLWEVVRHSCRVIEAAVELVGSDLSPGDRNKRGQYLITELEFALEAAQRARVALDWTQLRIDEVDDH